MSLLADLREVCGADAAVISGGDASEKYTTDWTKLAPGRAAAVVLPRNVAAVRRVLAHCNARRIGVVAQGGHTGMSGGATPDGSGAQVVLAMERMNAVREVDEVGRAMTVEAGCLLETAQAAASDAGLFFPLNLGARGSCQVGGNLATNAGGVNVLRYGNARDLCLGVEAALADGRVLNLLSPLRKDNSGYDLRNLIIGSEGTLAVITAATLKLFAPAPPCLTAMVSLPSVAAALRVAGRLEGFELSAAELMPRSVLRAAQSGGAGLPVPDADAPFTLLVEVCGDAAAAAEVLTDAIAAVEAADGWRARALAAEAGDSARRAAFWRLREEIPLYLARRGRWRRADVALPLRHLADFVGEMESALPRICRGEYILGFGHVGDGNLHISLRPYDDDPDSHPRAAAALLECVYDKVASYGGTFSAEHGVGQFKTAALARYKDAAALGAMRAIKTALDPNNILNPGKVFE